MSFVFIQTMEENSSRAQGTIEYLVIIAIVVVIALAVVGLMTGFLGQGSSVSTTTSQINLMTGALAIKETALSLDGNYLLRLKNNTGEYVTVQTVSIDGGTADTVNKSLDLGAETNVITSTGAACTNGQTKPTNITLTYTNRYNTTKTQTYAQAAIKCEDIQLTSSTEEGTPSGDPYADQVSLFMPFTENFSDTTGNISDEEVTLNPSGESNVFMTGDNYFAGSQSAYFPPGPWLSMPNKADAFDLGSGDFTIEEMVSFDSIDGYVRLFASWDNPNRNWWMTYEMGSLTFGWSNDCSDGTYISYATTPELYHWYHYAVSRSGDTIRLFIDGENVATDSISGSICNSPEQNFVIGALSDGDRSSFTGYMQGLRVTKGVARYTTNFDYPPDYLS